MSSLVVTDATVLHAFDYRETSRILRLATRDAGMRSVIARGARRPKNRFGAALDLFAEGTAQIVMHPTGDLHTLASFEVMHARSGLAASWNAFAAANALSEIMLRFTRDDAQPELYDAYATALAAIEHATVDPAVAGLAGAWKLVAELGFAPALGACASCDAPLGRAPTIHFSPRTGGVVCGSCAASLADTRELPADAVVAIAAWAEGAPSPAPDARSVRAHLRLLREFLYEHLADNKELRAFAVWERGDWSTP